MVSFDMRQRTEPSESSLARKLGYSEAITRCPLRSKPWIWLPCGIDLCSAGTDSMWSRSNMVTDSIMIGQYAGGHQSRHTAADNNSMFSEQVRHWLLPRHC